MSLSAGRVGVRADQVDSHGRVISPSFLNEIMEDLPEWTDLPVRVNGTEELIPSNPSVPVTSPILADIDYPDVRRNNQYFTYRESPTPVDGLAKIRSIKGNTLVWNQLVSRTSFPTLNSENGVTITWKDESTINLSGTAASTSWIWLAPSSSISANNHVYLITTSNKPSGMRFGVVDTDGNFYYFNDDSNFYVYKNTAGIKEINHRIVADTVTGFDAKINMFDLTLMFGETEANRIYALGQQGVYNYFSLLFPLPYYAYNSGSLLSFNGTAIKTTGKNQYNNATGLRNLYLNQNTGLLSNGGTTYIADLLPNKQYTLSGTRGNRSLIGFSRKRASELGNGDAIENISSKPLPYTFNSSDYCSVVYYSNTDYVATLGTDIQLELGSSVTDYEPYTTNTTNLPTETYFPTGMKSAYYNNVGTVYDELTPTKAITRVGNVNVETLGFQASTNFYYTSNTQSLNIVKGRFVAIKTADDNVINAFCYESGQLRIYVKDISKALSGILYYELATPVELPTLDFSFPVGMCQLFTKI